MGLGKTIQSIAFISAVLGKSGIPEVDTMLPQLSRLERIPIPEAPDKGTYGATVAGDDTYAPDYSGTGAPVLVVCPLSLLGNWQDELSAWGTFRVAVLHGASREQALLDVMSGRAEVALTTYAMVRQNEMLAEVPWHVVIFDEVRPQNPCCLRRCDFVAMLLH